MKVDVLMPKLGESLTEGTVLKWWKKVGDRVEKDETLLEVSTDKVDSEIPSPVAGVVAELLAEENQTIPIEGLLARIETEAGAQTEPPAKAKPEKTKKVPAPKEVETQKTGPQKVAVEKPAAPGDERFYSPLVRNMARQEGLAAEELQRIPGSGRGGRVTKKDLLAYLEKRKVTIPAAPMSFGGAEREMVIPMDAVRKKIAQHMRHSLDTAAHVYSVSECDMTRALEIMQQARPAFLKDEGFKLTITPFILHAVAQTILEFPRINSSVQGDDIIEHKYINLGIAVASEKGLIVPVIKNAEERSFRGLARAVNDLVSRTRENKLTLDDVQGGTYTVTNYGIFGNIIGLPIINQPNVAILGVGAIKKRPVVLESPAGDAIAIRSMCYISMSYDHRLVDGELGGRFMQRLVERLENFNADVV